MTSSGRARFAWVLTVSVFLTAIAFWNSTGQTRVFDDWSYHQWAAEAVEQGAWRALLGSGIVLHWSPLAWLIEATNASLVDAQDDRLIRGLNAAFLLIGLLTIGRFTMLMGLGAAATFTALGVVALHPINALLFYSYDIYTQLGSGTLMWLSLASALVVATSPAPARRNWWAVVSFVTFVASILIKEQGLAVVPGLVLITSWCAWVEKDRGAVRRLAPLIAAVGAAAMVFLLFWMRAAAINDDGPYRMCWSCAPGNLGLLVGGLLPPMPVLDVYLAIRDGSWFTPRVVAAAVSGAVVLAALAFGLFRLRQGTAWKRRLPLLVALLVISAFPVALLESVREFHAHALLFWFALLIAMAVDGWERTLARPAARMALAAVCVAYALVLYSGLRSNLGEIQATSNRTKALLADVNRALDTIPRDALVILEGWDEPAGTDDYSLIRMSRPSHLLDMGTAISVVRNGRGPRLVNRDVWEADNERPYVVRISRSGIVVQPPAAAR